MTSNNGEVKVEGGGLPVWDPAGAEDVRRARDAANATSSLPQPSEKEGSLIISCKVVFPENLGRRLGGLETAGAEDDGDWAEDLTDDDEAGWRDSN